MSSLEDKILGEKRHYYCSSSESESEAESGDEKETSTNQEINPGPPPIHPSENGCSTNTGPKGVLKDWQQFKQIEAEQRAEREKERLALIQRLSLTCKSHLDEEKEEDPDFKDMMDDSFLLEYSKKRMKEMLERPPDLPTFGCLYSLSNTEDFLNAIDKEKKGVTIIVHIYDEKVSSCKNMNDCLKELSTEYPEVKFCKFLASVAGVSRHFKISGVPALLIYRNETLIGNFVKVTEELGTEFSSNDLENFLIEHGMLIDKSFVPTIIRQGNFITSDDVD